MTKRNKNLFTVIGLTLYVVTIAINRFIYQLPETVMIVSLVISIVFLLLAMVITAKNAFKK